MLHKKSPQKNQISVKSLKKIKLIAMDVDGVLTDGQIHLDQDGQEIKTFNALDGLGIVLAKRSGFKVVLISARQSKALELRAKELGVDELYQNRMDKLEAFNDTLKKFNLIPDEICYIGDDLVDLPILTRAGFPVAVHNGVSEVKDVAVYVTHHKGGHGAVREVIELILKTQGIWKEILKLYQK